MTNTASQNSRSGTGDPGEIRAHVPGLGDKTTLEVAKVELSVPFKPVSTVYKLLSTFVYNFTIDKSTDSPCSIHNL